MPSWLLKGRIALLQGDKTEGSIASNYRPITCFPLMWKLLTGATADQIYGLYINRSCYQKNRKDAGKDLEVLVIYLILIGQQLEKSSLGKRIYQRHGYIIKKLTIWCHICGLQNV